MNTTIIYEDKASQVGGAFVADDDLWIPLEHLSAATGWEVKPQGLCRGALCIPVPAGREAEFGGRDQRLNLSALARLLGQPAVHDEAGAVWYFGEAVRKRRDDLLSLKAPDFSLPDLDGRVHTLGEYAGRKVLLLSWASW